MRPLTVAKKDYRDAIRSRTIWGLTVLFVLFLAGFAYVFTLVQGGNLPDDGGNEAMLQGLDLIFFLVGPAALIVPIVGLVLAHKSVAGEVESGSAKFLLSAPLTRGDAVLGKVVGRTGVLWTALLVGFAVAAAVIGLLYDQFDLVSYVSFVALTLLFGLAYVSIGVGISAATKSGTRAVIGVVAFYIVEVFVWDLVPNVVWYLLNGSFSPPFDPTTGTLDAPGWFFLIGRLSPSGSFSGTVTGFLGESSFRFEPAFPGGVPIYLTAGAALVILLAWIAIPAALGYLRFRGADIG